MSKGNCNVDLIDTVQQPKEDLSDYDRIGFASGIYFSKFHQTTLKFTSENLLRWWEAFMSIKVSRNCSLQPIQTNRKLCWKLL